MAEVTLSEASKQRLDPILQRFESSRGGRARKFVSAHVEPSRLPVPWLAYLMLVQIFEGTDLGFAEKTRWQIAFRYDGIEALLAHQKFGVRLYLDEVGVGSRDVQTVGDDFLRNLNAVVKAVEKDSLRDLVERKMVDAHVTLQNQNARLRRAYEHFRAQAEASLTASETPDTEIASDRDDAWPAVLSKPYQHVSAMLDRSQRLHRARKHVERVVRSHLTGAPSAHDGRGPMTELMAPLHRRWQRLDHGSFAAIAAINAYFSWLEHVLVLSLAFTEVKPGGGTLRTHIGDKWGSKFKRVFDVQERDAGRVLAQLHDIAETYRNTYGHGGFDKQGATIGIQIDGIGAVPARLSDVHRSPHFDLYPFGPTSFNDVTTTLDATDRFLREGPRRLAVQYIEAGLDVPFDAGFRAQLRRAVLDPRRFATFLGRRMNEVDDYLNMDF